MSSTYAYAAGSAIQPFWQRIHKFFLLPLDRAVLLRIAGLAASFVLSFALLFIEGFGVWFVRLAHLAVLVVGWCYGFKIIERSAKGYLRPSEYPLTDEGLVNTYLPYKFVAINVVFGLSAGLIGKLAGGGDFIGLALGLFFFAIVLPAVTMRLVLTGSLRGALNPAELVSLVRRIGKPYGALAVFVFFADLSRSFGMISLAVAGGFSAGAIGALSGPGASLGFGTIMLLFMIAAGFWYFTYMICALVGYTMYQYADQLDLAVVGPGERSMRSTATARTIDIKARTRDALVGQLVSAGDIKEAIALISDDLRERPNDLSLHARLHKLIVAEGSSLRIDDHTEKYLTLLIKSQNWREALDLYSEALARRADWTLRTIDNIVPLARAALKSGKAPMAGALIKGFDRKYPNHADVPGAYLVGAQLMAEWASKPDEARRILEHLLNKYPNAEAGVEAGRYLQVLDRMAAPR
jgi:tetratricopeptide (TPR) repeat protein